MKHNKNYKKTYLVCGLLIVLILLAVFALHTGHSDNIAPTDLATKQNASSAEKSDSQRKDPQQTSNKYPVSSADNSNVNVITPSGTFVNNHTPTMTSSMLSICSTTPSILCQITFTKDKVTRSLPSQTTDGTGNTVWSWTPKSMGLTTGTWQITVTATAGTKSATVTDPIDLEVQ